MFSIDKVKLASLTADRNLIETNSCQHFKKCCTLKSVVVRTHRFKIISFLIVFLTPINKLSYYSFASVKVLFENPLLH